MLGWAGSAASRDRSSAELSRRQLTFSEIFTILAIPGLIAAAARMIKQFAHPEEKPVGVTARRGP